MGRPRAVDQQVAPSTHGTRRANTQPQPGQSESDPLAALWLALVSGLFFVRWWMPTEATSLGQTLVVALGWMIALALAGWLGLRGTVWKIRTDRLLAVVGLIVLGHLISGFSVLLLGGDRRSALNLMCEWSALGFSFPLLRVLWDQRVARREWLIVAIAGIVTLSVYGLVQRAVLYPQMIRQYDRLRGELDQLEEAARTGQPTNPLQLQKVRSELLASGLSPQMLTGSGRVMFENRLKHSSEALGQFALANTFAGLLLPFACLLVGLTVSGLRPAPGIPGGDQSIGGQSIEASSPPLPDFRKMPVLGVGLPGATRPDATLLRTLVLGALATLVCAALLLTKSRTAFVGIAVALLVWALGHGTRLDRQRVRILKWAGLTLAGMAMLLTLATWLGALDRLVWNEAPKSLQYRLEYWWSTLQALRSNPGLGLGLGQFRQRYLPFKLPQSSEEIADPHNEFLDAWANGGMLALVGVCWLAAVIVRRAISGQRAHQPVDIPSPSVPAPEVIRLGATVRENRDVALVKRVAPAQAVNFESDQVTDGLVVGWLNPIRWGALGGVVALWALGGSVDSTLLGLLAGWCLAVVIVERILPECLSQEDSLVAAGGTGLLVHLLGAGGLAMPAITQLLWLCLAWAGSETVAGWAVPRWFSRVTVATGCGLAITIWTTSLQPVLLCRQFLDQGDYASSASQRENAYRQAASADSLSPAPWERLATELFLQWRSARERDGRIFQQAVDAQRKAIAQNPASYHGHQALGMFLAEYATGAKAASSVKLEAERELRRATDLYPHHAELLAEVARSMTLIGEHEQARSFARRALEQDDINRIAGHTDKWLSEETLNKLRTIAGAPVNAGSVSMPETGHLALFLRLPIDLNW